MRKPDLGFWRIWNMSFGFFGIQIAFALQNANVSRIFQSLGASVDDIAILWLAGPVTGLLVQPIIGHLSDRTWIPGLGRRRPFFLIGAILTAGALVIMPNAPYLWMAAAMLWILDASINCSMEPFRAFVGDMLPARRRTQGFAMQSVFIGAGAFLGSVAPWVMTEVFAVSNVAAPGGVPASVAYAFYIGAGALFAAILWTVLTTREYPPERLRGFSDDAPHTPAPKVRERPSAARFTRLGVTALLGGLAAVALVQILNGDRQFHVVGGAFVFLGLCLLLAGVFRGRERAGDKGENALVHIMGDLLTMPPVMRQLAVVQFFSWFGLFVMWVYSTPAVTGFLYETEDPSSPAYNEGANWVGWMFAIYNAVAAVYAFVIPWITKHLRRRHVHAANLLVGAVGLASYLIAPSPVWLAVSMVCVGVAWASILTMPYALLSDALPAEKLGVYMGIFNVFIVLPQLLCAGVMGPILRQFLGGEAIWLLPLGGLSMALGALSVAFVRTGAPAPRLRAAAPAAPI